MLELDSREAGNCSLRNGANMKVMVARARLPSDRLISTRCQNANIRKKIAKLQRQRIYRLRFT